MSFLTGLNGTVATVLICSLLFVDEAGLPLPIAPNEMLLLLAGVLVASGAFPIWVIVPVAYIAMAAGMITGYAWARTVGQSGLHAIAVRVRAVEMYNRALTRLRSASPWGIAGARLVPGLRPYATLVSGAAEVDIRTFLLGAMPALLLWEIILIAAGILVGLPIAYFLGRFEKIAARGAILIALGAIAWRAIRDETPDRRGGLNRITPRLRASLALGVDAGIVMSVVGGLVAIGRRVVGVRPDGWIELVVAAVLMIAVLIIGRGRLTPGEALFDTRYWHHSAAAAP